MLVDHLRHHGVTDQEMLAAGVATIASTGRPIDRFRDRVVFPIVHNGLVLGFVGRRNPRHPDDGKHGPKYLNTGDIPLFHKGDQLYTVDSSGRGRPVLVEGPIDAIAVTLATQGAFLGTAPLGTSLTTLQARQLAALGSQPIIATDADAAGLAAAKRDYWLLAWLSTSPLFADLPGDCDPADLVNSGQAAALARALQEATPLGHRLIDDRILSGQSDDLLEAIRVLAAMPPDSWTAALREVAYSAGVPETLVRVVLASAVAAWNRDPERASALWGIGQRTGVGQGGARRSQGGQDAAVVGQAARDLPLSTEETRPALEP